MVVALVLSTVGLSLLFLAIFLLYGLMMALTAVARDRVPSPGPEAPVGPPPESEGRERRARVAVIAVALARAEQDPGAPPPPEPARDWSPWRSFHAHRLLGLRGSKRRSR